MFKIHYIFSFFTLFYLLACGGDKAQQSAMALQLTGKAVNVDSSQVANAVDINRKRALSKMVIKYKPIIKKYAKRYGFDWRLIVAQIVQESGFKEKARSRR